MSDEAIQIYNAKVAKLEAELARHEEKRCECHDARECVCYEDDVPFPGTLAVMGIHCTPEFLLSCELDDIRM
jgi:hypothetical protein